MAQEKQPAPEEQDVFHHNPSDLDRTSHYEFQLLYKEATHNLLFAKRQQWVILAYLSFAFVGIYLLAGENLRDAKFINFLTVVSFILSLFAIVVEVFLQFWQINEKRKMRELFKFFSNSAQRIRSLKSREESDIHRYIMLFMLLAYILMAQIALLRALWNMSGA